MNKGLNMGVAVVLLAALVGAGLYLSKGKEEALITPNDFLAQEKNSLTNANYGARANPGNVEDLAQLDCSTATSTKSGVFGCYEEFYKEIVKKQGPIEAMVDLKTRYNVDSFVKNECHQLAHVVGRASTAKYPTVDEAYIRGDSACWSGYYHGVVEAVMLEIGTTNISFDTLDNICKNLAKREQYSFDHYNCVHGIGHGAMYITDNEMFKALEMCDILKDGWEKSSCWGGVFMENIIADNKNHFTKYLKADDPLYPCNAVKEHQKQTCYLMQTSYMLKLKGGNFAEVFNLCGTVGESYKDTCYQSLGRDASGWTISDPVRTKGYCMLGPDKRAQSNCVVGAVKDFISYHHSDTQAKGFCNSLDPDLKNTCLTTATAYYTSF